MYKYTTMGWWNSVSHGFSSIADRVTHTVNNAVHSATGAVSSVIHTAESTAQHAVSGVPVAVHSVAGIIHNGAQGALNALNQLGVPQFVKGLENSIIHDTDIPSNLNGLTAPVLSGATGLMIGAGAILAVLLLK